LISNLALEWGEHQFEFGAWVEYNDSSTYRRWYALNVNDPSTPYQQPANPLITQYGSVIDDKVFQMHGQDEWKIRSDFAIQYGFKSSLQFADGQFPVQPAPGAISGGSLALPVGEIITQKWFLPQLGALWDINKEDQLYANVQQNLRQFVTYGAGGLSPWSLASQSDFDLFKATVKPETSVTYEIGVRDIRTLSYGPLTGFDGQANLYHVDFSNRLLQISPTPVISAIVGGNPILENVGSVHTDGVDLAGILHFGSVFSFYDALSYTHSMYLDNYASGSTIVQTAGKIVPNVPLWTNKFAASANVDGVMYQLIGDYIGKRYATYTDDLSVQSYFLMSLDVSGKLPITSTTWLNNPRWRLNVSNLANRQGTLNVVVGAASGTYNGYPIPPRQVFLTLTANF
jgi:iron complex outermembrane receptor protein